MTLSLIALYYYNAVCEIDHQDLSFDACLFSHDIAYNNFFILYQNLAYIPADDGIIAFFIYSSQTHCYSSFNQDVLCISLIMTLSTLLTLLLPL